jgi:hypothetical protein
MLSRKQLWRKTPVPANLPSHRDSFDETNASPKQKPDNEMRAQAKDDSARKANAPVKLRSALSSSNLLTLEERLMRPKDTRTLRFSSTVHVCLIHCRGDLKHLFGDLFWKSEDYAVFKNEAVHELRIYLTAHGITAKEAIFQLYQPQDAERDQWMERMRKDFEKGLANETEKESSTAMDEQLARQASPYSSDEEDMNNADTIAEAKEDQRAFKFFTGLKTDVELNEQQAAASPGSAQVKLPLKTPSGPASSASNSMWAVAWHKKDEKK